MYTDAAGTIVGRAPSDRELSDSPTIRIAWVDADDEIHWGTTSHLTPDMTLDDVISGMTGPNGSPPVIGRPPAEPADDEFV